MNGDQEVRDIYLSQKDYGMWLQIQRNTFTNWANECLLGRGIVLEDLRTDLSDGVNLVALVESLSRQRVPGTVSSPSNNIQKLQNITISLDVLRQDGLRIINIDSSAILEGNLKLIMALIWQLILKYQVGFTGSQSKSWLLKWIQAAIPECNVTNLTTDLNDGIVLHALLEFCKPGLAPHWKSMDRENKMENCRKAMKLAKQHFNIPLILRPEDISSPELDELSAITYLSYFIKMGGPGYNASLERIAARVKPKPISNFTTDWQDGHALVNLVRSAGGSIHNNDTDSIMTRLHKAMEAGKQLNVNPLFTPEDFLSDPSEHLGLMAYTTQFLHLNDYTYTTSTSPLPLAEEHRSVSNTFINLTSTSTTHHDYFDRVEKRVNGYTKSDDGLSTHTSTIISPSNRQTTLATFHLINQTTGHMSRVEAPPQDELKVDVYSTGVILESKIRGAFNPDLFIVEAVSPNGRVIKMNGDGHYSAPFDASEIGRWNVSMSYQNRLMEKSLIDVCDPSRVKVKDLRGGFAGRQNEFHVDCTQAGVGDVGVDISFQGRLIPSTVSKTRTDGLYRVKFTPRLAGAHEINVHFNRAEVRDADFYTFDQEDRQRKAVFVTEITPYQGYVEVKASCDWEIDYITGSPFVCHVTDNLDIPVYRMQDGTVCGRPELIVDCSRVGRGHVEANILYNGLKYPCKVREESERPNVYRIRFKPRGPGVYKIWITFDGTPIKGTPFVQEIADLEDPSVFGDGLYRGVLGEPVTFTINPRGYPGQVAVTIDGPSTPEQSKLEIQPDGTILATYYPTERGLHKINVVMDGKHLKGSPFHPLIVDPLKVRVSGGWKPLLNEMGVIPLQVRKEKVLPFDVSEALPGELAAEVQGPRGKIPVTIDARSDGRHSVIFTPREIGKHYIHVRWGGYPLSQSPYLGEATQGEIDEDIYPNVRLVPIALRSPVESRPSSVVENYPPMTYRMMDETDSRQKQITFEPARVQIIQQEIKKPEPVRIYSYEAPTSPTSQIYSSASVTSSVKHPQKVILSGKGLREAWVRTTAYFKIDGTRADRGVPTAHLESVNYKIPVKLEIISADVYRCSYEPIKAGAYLLYINWNAKALRGSPFKVNIRDPVDASKVIVTFDTRGGYIGKDYDLKADTSGAGVGQLTAKCTDPVERDLPVRISANYNGTSTLKVKPVMAGVHMMEIRYDGSHVRGSPFAIVIREQLKTRTVKCWGPGLDNGVMHRFQSTFWVETTGAGAGDLRVRVIGPRGAFNVRMRKASEKDKIYQCFYDPVEPGLYTVHVQWSGVHIEGSPYNVLLGENDLDLLRMQEEMTTAGTITVNNTNLNSFVALDSNGHQHHHNDGDNDVFRRNSNPVYSQFSRRGSNGGSTIFGHNDSSLGGKWHHMNNNNNNSHDDDTVLKERNSFNSSSSRTNSVNRGGSVVRPMNGQSSIRTDSYNGGGNNGVMIIDGTNDKMKSKKDKKREKKEQKMKDKSNKSHKKGKKSSGRNGSYVSYSDNNGDMLY